MVASLGKLGRLGILGQFACFKITLDIATDTQFPVIIFPISMYEMDLTQVLSSLIHRSASCYLSLRVK